MKPEYIEQVSIERLVPQTLNINKLDERKLSALSRAISEGFRDPVEVCPLTNDFPEYTGPDSYLIVDGHHRVIATKRAGLASVSVLVFAYTPQQVRMRMLQTNTLRGRMQRPLAAELIGVMDSDDNELASLAGLRRDDIAKLRKLGEEANVLKLERDLAPQSWKLMRIAIAEDCMPLVNDALARAQARLAEQGASLPNGCYGELAAAIMHALSESPTSLFGYLREFFQNIEADTASSALIGGDAARNFRAALTRAAILAESEAQGRALELMAVEFLNIPTGSLR